MRHRYYGKKLSRTANERRRLRMVMARNFIAEGKIRTTIAKAKELQHVIEKLITTAKTRSRQKRRLLERDLADAGSVNRLLAWAKTRFATRRSGYTRIVRLGQRLGDGAERAILSFVDAEPAVEAKKAVKKKKKEEKDVAGNIPRGETKKKAGRVRGATRAKTEESGVLP